MHLEVNLLFRIHLLYIGFLVIWLKVSKLIRRVEFCFVYTGLQQIMSKGRRCDVVLEIHDARVSFRFTRQSPTHSGIISAGFNI